MVTLVKKSSYSQTSCFLLSFEQAHRSGVANQFFDAHRSGACTVVEILLSIKADCLRRILSEEGERLNVQKRLLSLLETQADEARLFAQEVIDREALPKEEKKRLKAERAAHYRREFLKTQPLTERQTRFLRSLGCQTIPANRWEASQMIDGHTKR